MQLPWTQCNLIAIPCQPGDVCSNSMKKLSEQPEERYKKLKSQPDLNLPQIQVWHRHMNVLWFVFFHSRRMWGFRLQITSTFPDGNWGVAVNVIQWSTRRYLVQRFDDGIIPPLNTEGWWDMFRQGGAGGGGLWDRWWSSGVTEIWRFIQGKWLFSGR